MTSKYLQGVQAIQELWCRPGEPILKCLWTGSDSVHFDVPGLGPDGKPPKTVGTKVKRGALGALAMGVIAALPGEGDDSDDVPGANPLPPSVWAFGPGPDCRTVATMRELTQLDISGCWTFTPDRMAWVSEVKTSNAMKNKAAAQEEKSALGMALGFGKGVADFAKDVVNGLRGNYASSGYLADELTTTERVECHWEIRREEVARVRTVSRQMPRECTTREQTYVRIEFHDGSGLDFSTMLGFDERMLTMPSPRP